MKKQLPYLRIIVVVFLTAAWPLVAQNSGFTYQGRLVAAGSPATGNYDFLFSIFDQPGEGTQQGAVIGKTNMAVTTGLFTAHLDFGQTVFDGGPRWIEVAVRPTGSESFSVLSPRQELTSAPHALRASVASTVTGTISDSQLSTNVALLHANQAFSGQVRFASASGTFSGNGAGLTNLPAAGGPPAGGVLTGRFSRLSSTRRMYASPSGTSAVTDFEEQVLMLSPNQSCVVSNLRVRLTSPPGNTSSYTFTFRVDGADTPVSCTISGAATSADSGTASATVPAGATISIAVQGSGSPTDCDAMFGVAFRSAL